MKHKKVDIHHALSGCRICAGAILMKIYEVIQIDDITRRRLEELVRS